MLEALKGRTVSCVPDDQQRMPGMKFLEIVFGSVWWKGSELWSYLN